MINIYEYITNLTNLLQDKFGGRLNYVGLQGSHSRGEATENSDIDIIVVIDHLTVSDLDDYRAIIKELPFFEKSCGFICSRDDLAKWNPLEICNLLHATKDYFGTLTDLVSKYTKADVCNFVKMSVNNLYHAICHQYVHSESNRDVETLYEAYKGTFFILQNLYYVKNNRFVVTKKELLSLLDGKDFEVLKRSMELKEKVSCDFSESFALLFSWCQEKIQEI